jgi:hypothetical protein
MSRFYVALTPRGKFTVLDAVAQAAEGGDLASQVHQVVTAQWGELGGVAQRTVSCPDGSVVLNELVDPDGEAGRNPFAEGVVQAMDHTTTPIRGTVVFTATTPDGGLTEWELNLLAALYDNVASML